MAVLLLLGVYNFTHILRRQFATRTAERPGGRRCAVPPAKDLTVVLVHQTKPAPIAALDADHRHQDRDYLPRTKFALTFELRRKAMEDRPDVVLGRGQEKGAHEGRHPDGK